MLGSQALAYFHPYLAGFALSSFCTHFTSVLLQERSSREDRTCSLFCFASNRIAAAVLSCSHFACTSSYTLSDGDTQSASSLLMSCILADLCSRSRSSSKNTTAWHQLLPSSTIGNNSWPDQVHGVVVILLLLLLLLLLYLFFLFFFLFYWINLPPRPPPRSPPPPPPATLLTLPAPPKQQRS